jgi:hypothetical protein
MTGPDMSFRDLYDQETWFRYSKSLHNMSRECLHDYQVLSKATLKVITTHRQFSAAKFPKGNKILRSVTYGSRRQSQCCREDYWRRKRFSLLVVFSKTTCISLPEEKEKGYSEQHSPSYTNA